MTARTDLERTLDIAQANYVDRGYGWERITSRGHKSVHVEPIFGGRARVPYAAIVRAALITPYEWEEYE